MKEIEGALFDLDGVVIDTEQQYTRFWDDVGKIYFPQRKTFAYDIKGMTLTEIGQIFFDQMSSSFDEVCQRLIAFENEMSYDYIPGAYAFIHALNNMQIPCAIVTSSDQAKMSKLYAQHSEIRAMFDVIVTSESIERSKPDPQCYCEAARLMGCDISKCVVFEDSINGLKAGISSGARVVGLSTTNPRECVASYAEVVIPDFADYSVNKILALLS